MLADPDVISWILKSLIIFGHMTVTDCMCCRIFRAVYFECV